MGSRSAGARPAVRGQDSWTVCPAWVPLSDAPGGPSQHESPQRLNFNELMNQLPSTWHLSYPHPSCLRF